MFEMRKIIGGLILALSIMLLAACNGGNGEPTLDANALFTAAAMTVQAELTETAAHAPTATEIPTPTETLTPTIPFPAGTDTGVGGATQPVPAFTVPGFGTATQPLPKSGDQCQWVSNYPADNETITHYYKFDIYWVIKNSGTTTWTTEYLYQAWPSAKDNVPYVHSKYNLKSNVAPNEEVQLIVDVNDMENGNYYTIWVLTDPNGVSFCNFDVTFTIADKTPDPDITATPTKTHTILENCCVYGTHGAASDYCKDQAALEDYDHTQLGVDQWCDAHGYPDYY